MSLAAANGPQAAAAAPAAAAPAVAAEVVGQSPGKPFGKRYLADKLATGTAAELQQMIQVRTASTSAQHFQTLINPIQAFLNPNIVGVSVVQ